MGVPEHVRRVASLLPKKARRASGEGRAGPSTASIVERPSTRGGETVEQTNQQRGRPTRGLQRQQPAFGMTDPDEEQQKLERDMWRVVWVLLPIAAVIFLLLVIQRLGLLR
jgi:hypothetical protein